MATSDMTGKTEDFGSNKESELKKLRQRVTELETLVKQNVSLTHTIVTVYYLFLYYRGKKYQHPCRRNVTKRTLRKIAEQYI